MYWNAGWGLGRGYISLARLPQQLHEQHVLLSFFVLGLLSLRSFCSAVSTARRAVRFDSTFLFQAPPLFAESFMGHFENTIVPYRRPPKLHFENFRINFRFTLETWLWEIQDLVYFQIFHKRLSLINEYETYGTTYEHICTYIHTYIHT